MTHVYKGQTFSECPNTRVVFVYCCTVHLDNIKITFTKECGFYLTYKCLNLQLKRLYIRSYMFRSI
jgi:hypothetical protein